MNSLPPVLSEGRQSPSEELLNRRKIRLIQVRQQEQLIAKRVRNQVKQQKENVIKDVAEKLSKEFDTKQASKYAESKEKYMEGLSKFGGAHKNAESDVVDQALCMANFEKQKVAARKRYNEAVKQARMISAIEEENKKIIKERKLLVMKKEMVRAKQIAMLPKKETNTPESIDAFKSETTILANGTETFLVERASDENNKNAKVLAEDEQERCTELDKDRICDHEAQIERARVRHLAALQKTRMNIEYQKLESDVKYLQRKSAFARKNNFSGPTAFSGNFGQATDAEMLETLGIPPAWNTDLVDVPDTKLEQEEESLTSELLTSHVTTTDTEIEETNTTEQSDIESSEYSSGLMTSDASGADSQEPLIKQSVALKDNPIPRVSVNKKKKAVAFEIPTKDSPPQKRAYEDNKVSIATSLEDKNIPDASSDEWEDVEEEETTSNEDLPQKTQEQNAVDDLHKVKTRKTAPSPKKLVTVSHEDVKRRLLHPDVIAFQKRILEAHSSSVSETSSKNTTQSFDETSSTSNTSTTEHGKSLLVNNYASNETVPPNMAKSVSSDDSVVSLEDGLQKIATGITKREEELKRHQAILEDYKAKLLAQQKQHAVIAKLSAKIGKEMSPEPDSKPAESNKSWNDSTSNIQNTSNLGKPLNIPSLLLMTDPNIGQLSQNTSTLDTTSPQSSLFAKSESPQSGSVSVHEISSNSAHADSGLSGENDKTIEDEPFTPVIDVHSSHSSDPMSQSSFSFVKLTPDANESNFREPAPISQHSSISFSDISFDKQSFIQLQPETYDPKNTTAQSETPANMSSFVELTPQNTDVDLRDVSTSEALSNLDISEHPLSTHEHSEVSFPPLSSVEDTGGSIQVRTDSETEQANSDPEFNQSSWKSLLGEAYSNTTTSESTVSDKDSSVETLRFDDTVIDTQAKGLFDVTEMSLVSLNSTVEDAFNLDSSRAYRNPNGNSRMKRCGAILKEKLPSPNVTANRTMSPMLINPSPSTEVKPSDKHLETLLAYLKRIDLQQQ